MQIEKYYISWAEFHDDVKILARKIKQSGTFNKIIAISRGGLLPAGILAYELDIRNSQAINISSYDNNERREDDKIELDCNVGEVDNQTLIVDDLSDTGRTFRLVRKLYPQACYAAVYSKPKGHGDVDICAKELPDKWIVFPWDIE